MKKSLGISTSIVRITAQRFGTNAVAEIQEEKMNATRHHTAHESPQNFDS